MIKGAQYIVLATFLAAGTAFAADKRIHSETDVRSDSKGNYKGTSRYEATDEAGTTMKSNIRETESATFTGGRKVEQKVDTSTDPKGLMNKTWSERESVARTNPDGSGRSEDHSQSIDRAGTSHDVKETAKTTVHSDGTTKTTIARKTVTDPKGLMNKSTAKSEETVTRAANGEVIGRSGDTSAVTAR